MSFNQKSLCTNGHIQQRQVEQPLPITIERIIARLAHIGRIVALLPTPSGQALVAKVTTEVVDAEAPGARVESAPIETHVERILQADLLGGVDLACFILTWRVKTKNVSFQHVRQLESFLSLVNCACDELDVDCHCGGPKRSSILVPLLPIGQQNMLN